MFVTEICPGSLDSYRYGLSKRIVNEMAGRTDEDNRKDQVAAKQNNIGGDMLMQAFFLRGAESPPAVKAEIVND